jgi:hypothetical protein
MSVLINKFGRLGLLLLFGAGSFVVVYFYFYGIGGYDAPPPTVFPIDNIKPPSSAALRQFDESPLIQKGTLLIDGIHGNNFTKSEMAPLISRVKDRGYEVEFMGTVGRFGNFSSLSENARLAMMEEKLRRADSLAVIVPTDAYSAAEVDLVERFILRKGGKVLLLADPTRRHRINSLAERFGLAFQTDYLYNTNPEEYDLNFQNILISNFDPEDEVTAGLEEIALYTASSIRTPNPGIAFTSGGIHSSMLEQVEPFYPLVKAAEGRVLALSDITFMIPPRNAVLDNNKLISNIADYLTSSQRSFDLADFPGFFRDDVDILVGRSELFDVGGDLKDGLADFRINATVRGVEDITTDTIYVGLYEDATDVAQYLELTGLNVGDVIRTPFTPDIQRENTAIIMLNSSPERQVLVILGDSEGALRDVVVQLSRGSFRDGLVGDFVGVYRTP